MNYEESIKRLEDILGKIESKDISLEESVNLYKEGASLVKEIQNLLNKSEGEVKKLLESENQIIKEEFGIDE